jgi:ribosomal protein S18 acetylase RimI-like enzyme
MASLAQGDDDGCMQGLPGTRAEGVRKAVEEDVPALIPVLARAFDRDPFINWVVRQDARRGARIEWSFEVMLRLMSGDLNETYATTDLSGAAIWRRPGEFKLPLTRQLRLLPAFAKGMGWTRIPALLKMIAQMEPLHEQLVPEPHYYLFVIGVDPIRQGHGLGSELIEPGLSLCDREGKRAYVETTNQENLGFYARHGFEIVHTVERGGWPQFWLMIRAARALASSR